MRIISWNIGGLQADVIETLPEQMAGYGDVFCLHGENALAINAIDEARPLCIHTDLGQPALEGNVIIAEYIDFYLYNVYFNAGASDDMRDILLAHIQNMRKTTGRGLVLCGNMGSVNNNDYAQYGAFLVSKEIQPLVKDMFDLEKVTASEHCPMGIELDY